MQLLLSALYYHGHILFALGGSHDPPEISVLKLFIIINVENSWAASYFSGVPKNSLTCMQG